MPSALHSGYLQLSAGCEAWSATTAGAFFALFQVSLS